MLGAIFVDLDGTLVGTREANLLAYRAACAESGRDLTAEAFAWSWGRDSRAFLPQLFPGIDRREVDQIREAKARLYPQYLDTTRVNEALRDLLVAASDQVRCGLVTTAKRGNADHVLRRHGLMGLFAVRVYGDDVPRGKPSPDCYLLALEKAGVGAGQALAFEDSRDGIASARGAGIQVLRVEPFE